jgi:hypothetical protein
VSLFLIWLLLLYQILFFMSSTRSTRSTRVPSKLRASSVSATPRSTKAVTRGDNTKDDDAKDVDGNKESEAVGGSASSSPETTEQSINLTPTQLQAMMRDVAKATALAVVAEAEDKRSAAAEQAAAAEAAKLAQLAAPLLLNRGVPIDEEKRLRGGEERRPGREKEVERHLLETGAVTAEEYAKIKAVLAEGSKVPNPSLFEFYSDVASDGRQGAGLFAKLRREGITAPSDVSSSSALLDTVVRELTDRSVKEGKKGTIKFKSFEEFYTKFVSLKLMGPRLAESDSQTYWQVDWHVKSVTLVFTKYGWPCAGAYHDRVMEEWTEGLLDLDSFTSSQEFMGGHLAAAVHKDALLGARIDFPLPSKNKGGGHAGSGGATAKAKTTDTWCEHHKLWWPAGSKHDTKSCRAKGGAGKLG